MTDAPKIHPLEAALLTALFAVAISLPLVKQLTVGEPDTSAFEKRTLATMPSFVKGWKWRINFAPMLLDAYYRDHFGFRFRLLEADTFIHIKWFRVSPRAVIGKNGWLFLKMDPPLFAQTFTESDLAIWKSYLEHRQQWLAARGIKYLFVVPPDKDSIYPDFLPPTSRPPPGETLVDQLARYLKETHSSVDIFSLKEPVLAAKTQEQQALYYKQDSHWNSLGAYYGYQAIIDHLAPWFPALKAKPRVDYRLTDAREAVRDIALVAGPDDFAEFNGPELLPLTPASLKVTIWKLPGFMNPPFVTQLQDTGNLPRAVMMRDSFAIALAPYLSENFSRITFFWPVYGLPDAEKTMGDYILKEKPDIFIEERIQRFLYAPPDEKIIFGGEGEPGTGAKKP